MATGLVAVSEELQGDVKIWPAENIPVCYMNEKIREGIAVYLDPAGVSCYKHLSEILLNFNNLQIQALDARTSKCSAMPSSTMHVLQEYQKCRSNSVGAIRSALRQMERMDALEFLEDCCMEIVGDFKKKRNVASSNYCHGNSCNHQQGAKVFITYAEANASQVLHIATKLLDKTGRILLDNNKSPFCDIDHTQWLKSHIQNADFIVMCISREYQQRLSVGYDPSPHSLSTCRIYKMLSENPMSSRGRIIPIRLDDDKVTLNLFKGVSMYKWPHDMSVVADKLSMPFMV